MLRSLAFKWTATLLLTSLIGVVLVGVFTYRTTVTEYDRLRRDQALSAFVQDVTRYYRRNRTWIGLDVWLRDERGSGGAGHGVPMVFALVSADSRIVTGQGPFRPGDLLPSSALAEGTPIVVDGVQVGTVLMAQPPELDAREQLYIDTTNRALLFGALGASGTALLIALLLARQFLRPLSELTDAITAMRAGELDQRVAIRTRDELGLLAQTFNEMSANLHRANQLRKQMTADIAHDLRTPLTVIAGYLEALRDGTLKPTPERFGVMTEEVNLLKRLVEDLRTLSLADAGELRLMRAAAPPRDLLERAAASFREAAAAASVNLWVDVADSVPDVWVDSERMARVLGNLVSNALRYTPAGGSVTLRARQSASGVLLTVSDTGTGIAPEELPKIFDRFYRGDRARGAGGGESGLGLAIARSIVEAHGGTIAAHSAPGSGTTILLTLPSRSV